MAYPKLPSYWRTRRHVVSSVDAQIDEIVQEGPEMCFDVPHDGCIDDDCALEDKSVAVDDVYYECNTLSDVECSDIFNGDHSANDNCEFSVDDGTDGVEFDYDDFYYPYLFLSEDSDSDHADSDDDTDDDPGDEKLQELLSEWAANCKIPLTAIGSLLRILHAYHPALPLDPCTLLDSLRKVPVKNMSDGGYYYHFGITQYLEKYFKINSMDPCFGEEILQIQINIDGLPVSKSTNLQLWPILGIFKGSVNEDPFTIGIYEGHQKPKNVDEFVEDFVNEMKCLQNVGITLDGHQYFIAVHSFVCDAPARAMLKNVKLHCAYNACERCIQKGEWCSRVIYPSTDAQVRTNVLFDELSDTEHHHGLSPLQGLNIGFVSDFVLDYMHLVCLGVVRRLLSMWMRGPLTCRLSAGIVQQIAQRLVALRQCIPSEFARKPRTVLELDRWKATEFRQFLLYTGPVVLKGLLNDTMYQHFMLLSFSMYCLLNPEICFHYADYVKSCLVLFVNVASDVYGKEVLVYNTHSLIHIVDDVKVFGSLENVSCFPFENHLRCMKRLIRRPGKPLQQIVCRLAENNNVKSLLCRKARPLVEKSHVEGPVPDSIKLSRTAVTEYQKLNIEHCTFKPSMKDGIMLLENGQIALLSNVISHGGETSVVYQRFSHQRPLYKYPLSSSDINIVIVGKLCADYELISHGCIVRKCVCIPLKDGEFAVIPLVSM